MAVHESLLIWSNTRTLTPWSGSGPPSWTGMYCGAENIRVQDRDDLSEEPRNVKEFEPTDVTEMSGILANVRRMSGNC